MGLNRTTPKRAMKYWRVGWNGVIIKARTARVAARKWLRDNAVQSHLVRDHELDNPGGTGEMPSETLADARWRRMAKRGVARLTVDSVHVVEVPKGSHGPSAPHGGAFWRGSNRSIR